MYQAETLRVRRLFTSHAALAGSLALCVAVACSGSDEGGSSNNSGGSAGTVANAGSAGSSSNTGGTAGTSNGGSGVGAGGTAAAGSAGQSAGGASGENAGGSGGEAGGAGGASGGAGGEGGGGGAGGADTSMSFFITSTGNATGNLGGLAAADVKCQTLAMAVGQGAKTWHAYLSTENPAVNAGDRIGSGPWYNSLGEMVAADLAELHAPMAGDYMLLVDENGDTIPGNWEGSVGDTEHDILTGTNADGTLATGKTCADWTSDSNMDTAVVGHSDGLGPGGDMADNYRPWNSSHDMQNCSDTAPRGGAGRIYCFAVVN